VGLRSGEQFKERCFVSAARRMRPRSASRISQIGRRCACPTTADTCAPSVRVERFAAPLGRRAALPVIGHLLVFLVFFFANASRSVFRRRDARFFTLVLPWLCPIRVHCHPHRPETKCCFGCRAKVALRAFATLRSTAIKRVPDIQDAMPIKLSHRVNAAKPIGPSQHGHRHCHRKLSIKDWFALIALSSRSGRDSRI
jgi:hypothetical protein